MASAVGRGTNCTDQAGGNVQKLRDMWTKAFNSRDMDRIATFYAEDAVELPLSGTPAVRGISAIKESMKLTFANGVSELKVSQMQVGYTEPLAVELATYAVSVHARKGESREEKGRLVATWRRDGSGRFKITISVWSREPE